MSTGTSNNSYTWGNATYINLSVNESYVYSGKKITLVSMENNYCTIKVGDTGKRLVVARRTLPDVMEGIRVFVADNKNVKELTSDSEYHGLLTKDAFICLSDAARPLLDPERYCFPISRRDGYDWHMEESSHMFAYYGHASYFKSPYHLSKGDKFYRSHEGIDFDLHDARGIEKHPLVAVEAGTVRMVLQANQDEMCIIIESASDANIYYIYKHIYVKYYYVQEGQKVQKGDILAYIWGDGVWGHLHFAVVYQKAIPSYDLRYFDLLNCFPQAYELWYGDLSSRAKVWTEGYFTFGHKKWMVENKLRAAVYDDLVGYGWKVDEGFTAGAVDIYEGGNLRLEKVLHPGTAAEYENPNNYYDFEVAVPNGGYIVNALVGDRERSSWQKISFSGVDAGTYELGANHYAQTSEKSVEVEDGRLKVRIVLKDSNTRAGISQLYFKNIRK